MSKEKDMMDRKIEVRVDAYTRICLTAIAVLLTVVAVGLWAEAVPGASPASAGPASDGTFGDMGPRIAAQLDAVNKTNAKLDEIIRLLTSGQVKVQLAKEKDDKGGAGANAPQPKSN
jgi:Spy/CpxP family protein refolding chaperone